jgi:hypothetical protein
MAALVTNNDVVEGMQLDASFLVLPARADKGKDLEPADVAEKEEPEEMKRKNAAYKRKSRRVLHPPRF